MKLFDLDVPQTKQSKKVLESYFGNSIDFAAMKPQAASDMLTKVRGLIYEHRSTRSLVKSENDTTYMKLIVMERGLSARLREASITLEPQTGATQIKSDGDVIGSTDDQATAMQFKKDVEDGKIKLGEVKATWPKSDDDESAPDVGDTVMHDRLGLVKVLKITDRDMMMEPAEYIVQSKKGKAKISFDQLVMGESVTEADYSAKKARAGKDIGKKGKNFKKISKDAAKRYGSKEAGDKVAGAILAKMREGYTLRTKSGRFLNESEVQQAQVVLAAQDMVDRMQKMLEDVTSMQFKDLPALAGSIQTSIGTNEAQAFNDAAGQSLAVLVDAIQASKVEMETAQGTLTGIAPVVPGQEEVAGEPAIAEPVADPLAPDPIDATADVNVDAEAGGQAVDVNVDVDDAALGRARR
tara:strand:- start:98 stop:1327 length:1230 start_codon:yes stop_codon:yes gene_type:complete